MAGPTARGQAKHVLLATLISPSVKIMRASANAVATIAAVEISRGEWLDIITTFAENSLNQDSSIRRASITTLGYICEELKQAGTSVNNDTC